MYSSPVRSPSAQVVVVGAGPTGLMLAVELRLGGVEVVVVDERPTGTVGESRAPGIQARTLEVFDQRGLLDRFLERGRRQPAVLFSGIPIFPQQVDPGWPTGLILAQHETERILAERAEELGVLLLWSTRLVDLEQRADGVDVYVDGDSGPAVFRANFVVGCDGGRSTVRQICAIPFPGDVALSDWLVADARLDAPPEGAGVFGRNERIGTYQISRTEPQWFRISLMRTTPPPDRRAAVDLDELRAALIDGLGTDYGLTEARWMSRFTDATHQATEYRRGRVFLAGDAAHTHPPIGGQGLNLGIQDAVNLGWKLAAVIHGSPDSLLDTYHHERHAVATAMMQWTKAQTALIKPGNQADALRGILASVFAMPDVTVHLAGALSGLAVQYPLGDSHPLLGRRMPNFGLHTVAGETTVFRLLHQGRFVLINLGASDLAETPAGRWADRVDYLRAELSEPRWHDQDWQLPVFGRTPAVDAVLIRPDGYVCWVNPNDQPVDTVSLAISLTQALAPR